MNDFLLFPCPKCSEPMVAVLGKGTGKTYSLETAPLTALQDFSKTDDLKCYSCETDLTVTMFHKPVFDIKVKS